MLCENCHQREATSHVNKIEGDVVTSRDLCSECFESSHTEARGITQVWEAGCQYCGGPPVIGGADPLATIGGIHKLRCMCKLCSDEYHRFLQVKMPGFGTGAMTKEQLSKMKTYDIPAIFSEANKHMKQWVSEKGL